MLDDVLYGGRDLLGGVLCAGGGVLGGVLCGGGGVLCGVLCGGGGVLCGVLYVGGGVLCDETRSQLQQRQRAKGLRRLVPQGFFMQLSQCIPQSPVCIVWVRCQRHHG